MGQLRLTTANTADILVFWQDKLLLVKRKNEPYKDQWALPGGFFEPDKGETLEETAVRELYEETGYSIPAEFLSSTGTYSTPGRDPRGPVITTAYAVTIIDPDYTGELKAGDDAKEAAWFPLDDLPLPLAFDHEDILADALE